MRMFKAIVRALKVIPPGKARYKGPLKIHIRSYFERPGTRLKRLSRLKKSAPEHMHQKPDADNIAKFVGDCLNGLAYHDDAQIMSNKSEKFWCIRGERVEVELEYLE